MLLSYRTVEAGRPRGLWGVVASSHSPTSKQSSSTSNSPVKLKHHVQLRGGLVAGEWRPAGTINQAEPTTEKTFQARRPEAITLRRNVGVAGPSADADAGVAAASPFPCWSLNKNRKVLDLVFLWLWSWW